MDEPQEAMVRHRLSQCENHQLGLACTRAEVPRSVDTASDTPHMPHAHASAGLPAHGAPRHNHRL